MVIESGVGPFTARWAGLASLGTEGTEVGRGLKPPTGLRRSAKPTIAAGTLGAARSDESGGMAQAGDGLKAGGGGGREGEERRGERGPRFCGGCGMKAVVLSNRKMS